MAAWLPVNGAMNSDALAAIRCTTGLIPAVPALPLNPAAKRPRFH